MPVFILFASSQWNSSSASQSQHWVLILSFGFVEGLLKHGLLFTDVWSFSERLFHSFIYVMLMAASLHRLLNLPYGFHLRVAKLWTTFDALLVLELIYHCAPNENSKDIHYNHLLNCWFSEINALCGKEKIHVSAWKFPTPTQQNTPPVLHLCLTVAFESLRTCKPSFIHCKVNIGVFLVVDTIKIMVKL